MGAYERVLDRESQPGDAAGTDNKAKEECCTTVEMRDRWVWRNG